MTLLNKSSIIGKELFQISLLTYLALLLLETFRPGSVSNYFNLNYLVTASLITGVLMVMGNPTADDMQEYRQYREEMIRISTKKIKKVPDLIRYGDMFLKRKQK